MRYTHDFASMPAGIGVPDEMTIVRDPGDQLNLSVLEDEAFLQGKAIRVWSTTADSDFRAVAFDALTGAPKDDFDMVWRSRVTNGTMYNGGAFGWWSPSSGTAGEFLFGCHWGDYQKIGKSGNGVSNWYRIGDQWDSVTVMNQWVWWRMRRAGGVLMAIASHNEADLILDENGVPARGWDRSEADGWEPSEEETAFGFFLWSNQGPDTEYDYFSVAVGEGEYAPTPDEDEDPSPGSEIKIMPVGDSITITASQQDYSYRYTLYHHLSAAGIDFDFVGPHIGGLTPSGEADWDKHCYAVSGWGISNVADGIQATVNSYSPDILTMMIGINDIGGSGTPDFAAMIANYEAIIDNARAAKEDIVFFCALLPPRASDRDVHVNEFNSQLETLLANKDTALSPIHIVDQNLNFINSYHNSDNLHPTDQGEVRQAMRFADALFHHEQIGAYFQIPDTPTLSVIDGPALSWTANNELADVYDIEHNSSVIAQEPVSAPGESIEKTFSLEGLEGSFRVRGRRLVYGA